MLGARARVAAAPTQGSSGSLTVRGQRRLPPLPPFAPRAAVEDSDSHAPTASVSTSTPVPESSIAAASSSSSSSPSPEDLPTNRRSALIAAGSLAAASATLSPSPPPASAIVSIPDPDALLFDDQDNEIRSRKKDDAESKVEAFEFVVPLRVVAPRGAVPSEWATDFRVALGRRATFSLEARAQVEDIVRELSSPEKGWEEAEREGGGGSGGGGGAGRERQKRPRKQSSRHRSAATADAVCLSDEWLGPAVARGLVQPIEGAEEQRWWKSLPRRWRSLCYRDRATGRRAPLDDPRGSVFASPFRWGCTLVAFRPGRLPRELGSGGSSNSSESQQPPSMIVDWSDLLHPSLRGRVAFSDSPRDLLTAALGVLGLPASPDPALHAVDARALRGAVLALRRQALTFDGRDHARALAAGDAAVCVGSSADLLPLATRSSAVATSVPAGGTALWADLWCVPTFAGTSFASSSRGESNLSTTTQPSSSGASPLLPAWFELALTESRSEKGRGLRGGGGASPLLLPPTIEEQMEMRKEEEEEELRRRKRWWWQVWKSSTSTSTSSSASSASKRLPLRPPPSPDRAERARAALVVGGALPSTEVLSRSDFCVPPADDELARAFREALRP